MSDYDLGVVLCDRETRRAAHLLKRSPSLGLAETAARADGCGDKFEPDWRRFEAVYARGELPAVSGPVML